MAQIILALITPRAGEWNHRYIIPFGKSWNDTLLADTCLKLESPQGDQYGILMHTTVQQQGGREGTEKLFFYAENFNDLPAKTRQDCREQMKDWFDKKREKMLQNADWSKEGKTQVIPNNALSKLYRDLENLVNSKTIDSEDPIPPKSFNYKGCVFMTVISIALLTILSFGQVRQWFAEQGEKLVEVSEKVVENVWGSSHDDTTATQADDKKLIRDTFTPLVELKNAKGGEQMGEDEYDNILVSVLGTILSKTLYQSLSKLEGFSPYLENLQSDDKELVFFGKANEDEKEKWEILRGIDPIKFHELLNECRHWNIGLEYDPDNYKVENSNICFDTKFYWSRTDYDDAAKLREWLRENIFNRTKEGDEAYNKTENSRLKETLDIVLQSNWKGTLSNKIKDKVGDQEKTNEILNSLQKICEPYELKIETPEETK